MTFRERVQAWRYNLIPDHLIGEILTKRWTDNAIPFIALGRSETGENLRWIDLDFEGVARQSVDRLVAHGHRRIAIAIPADDINLGHVFHASYRAALDRHGIAYAPNLVFRQDRIVEGGLEIAASIAAMADAPTALILSNDALAPSLYQGLKSHGKLPGRDIAIIGFRDNPRARYLIPSLTSHCFSLAELGGAVAETLLAGMPAYAGLYPGQDDNKIWPLTFMPGDSDAFSLPPEP